MKRVALVPLALLLAGCSGSQKEAVEPGSTGASLYEGFDGYARSMGTSNPEAQAWFDQGMQFLYGFNHAEAIRSFQEAAARDPENPMPWWGIAHASGININDPMMEDEDWRRADHAVTQAKLRIKNASPLEKGLIRAARARYTYPPPAEPRAYDQAYADAMAEVRAEFPNDPDVAVMYAESLMNLQPWDYWTNEGEPRGKIETVVATIERAIELDPDHPGALHLYIHAVEASSNPDRAEAAADRLLNQVPGSGHLVHMPSHLFIRVGRYSDAAVSNEMAVAADRRYFEKAPPPGYYSLYYGHNLHFLSYAAMMEGNYETALRAARDLEAEVPEQSLRDLAFLIEGIMPSTFHVMVRFGKWEDILAEPERPEFRYISNTVRHYARGIAYSALGDVASARKEQELFEQAAARIPAHWQVFNNPIGNVLPIARGMLEGEIAYREGRLDDAFSELRTAIEYEDDLVYDEPPGWMLPVRHSLGALLVEAGRHAEAEQVYREDLIHNRGNGWALIGLRQCLLAQGKQTESEAISASLSRVWPRADVSPTSSCYCAPSGQTLSVGGEG